MDFKANRILQKGKSKQLQAKSEQLQKENNEMEQRIVSLKQMMQKEKDERERLGGSRWKSSRLPQDPPQAVPSNEKKSNKPKIQPKFRLLTDKPIEKYTKKTTLTNDNNIKSSSVCGQCENSKAKLECVECGELYCPPCYKQFHAKGAMRKHNWKPFDQERQSASKDRTVTNNSDKSRAPATNTRQSSIEETVSLGDPTENESAESKAGASLLEGDYNEQESAASFQEALKAWRNDPPDLPAQRNGLWVNPVNEDTHKGSKTCETETDVSLIPGKSQSLTDLKLNFNSSLSYADRLMLKKHRKEPQSPGGYDNKGNSPLSKKTAKAKTRQISPKTGQVSPKIPQASLKYDSKETRTPAKKQIAPAKNDIQYPSAVNIRLLHSDEDVSSDREGGSPIITENADENPTPRTDRCTLSQMGRLAIVELSFSDPENDSKSIDGNHISVSSSQSSMSIRRAASSIHSHNSDPAIAKPVLVPHPPAAPPNTYVARQKILMEQKKKGSNRPDVDMSKVKKLLRQEDKRWKPSEKYVGLDSFFMAGVEKEDKENMGAHAAQNVSKETAPPLAMDTNSCPQITVGLADSWRPDSSLSQAEGPSGVDKRVNKPKIRQNQNKAAKKEDKLKHDTQKIRNSPKIPNSPSKSVGKDHRKIKEKNTAATPSVKASLNLSSENDTPRMSMTDFDFLSAMPPLPKGDDLSKLHRASTVTLFALSPQPPDIWNDDSEIDLLSDPHSPKYEKYDMIEKFAKKAAMSKSEAKGTEAMKTTNSARLESDQDDALALEALSMEITDKDITEKEGGETKDEDEIWDDDSLSIEDNDDGSGLTSSGDGDTHYEGDDSDDVDLQDVKDQIVELNTIY